MNRWIVNGNHIAYQVDSEVHNFSASEMLAIFSAETPKTINNIAITPVRDFFSELTISKVGAFLKSEIYYDNRAGKILLDVFCIRNKKKISLDFVDSTLIDHAICDNEWFYITGNTQGINDLFHDLKITGRGEISISQYISIIRYLNQHDSSIITNLVLPTDLKTKLQDIEQPPCGLNATLYPYQSEGFSWLDGCIRNGYGCILADDMGLGKTLQIIALIQRLINDHLGPVLVIVPASLIKNWFNECAKFAPSLRTFIHYGSRRTGLYSDFLKFDVIIMSYGTAVSDYSMLTMINWELVVLDEAQNIKNPNSERTRFIKKINRKIGIAVTGTPFENHLSDIWSITDFVLPGALGTLQSFSAMIPDDVNGAQMVEPLITPIMLRRKVKDVAKELPEKIIISQPISMSEKEALAYEALRNDASRTIGDNTIALESIQKLRMYCTHPAITEKFCNDDYCDSSLKYQRICELLEEIKLNNEKSIIFTSYNKMFDIFNSDLSARLHIPIWMINGETPIMDRQPMVDEFNEYQGPAILILNPRAAGRGLNITGANHVIHYNLEWNPALEDQSTARAYRKGQTKTVFVYRLYYENTVEQIINERLDRKRNMAKVAVVGKNGRENSRNDLLRAINISPLNTINV